MRGFITTGDTAHIERDDDDVLDYVLDYTDWLQGDTLSAVDAVASGVTLGNVSVNAAPITVDGESVAAGKAVVFWLSGGTSGVRGSLSIKITSAAGRVRDETYPVITRSW